MKKFRVRYLTPAASDLVEIIEYVKLDNPFAAGKLFESIDTRIGILESFPLAGIVPKDRSLRQKKYRILVIDAYLAFYKVVGKTVWIHRIVHGKRKYEHLV